MLVIRMQRTGRKGHAMFRVVVQDSRRTPTSGKLVAQLGSYDPHSKAVTLNKEKAEHYLTHGAQPSERVARLLQAEGIKLPSWVKLADKKQGVVRNVEKRRSTAPAPEVEPEAPAAEESAPAEEAATEAPVKEVAEAPAEESTPAAEPEESTPAAEPEESKETEA